MDRSIIFHMKSGDAIRIEPHDAQPAPRLAQGIGRGLVTPDRVYGFAAAGDAEAPGDYTWVLVRMNEVALAEIHGMTDESASAGLWAELQTLQGDDEATDQ